MSSVCGFPVSIFRFTASFFWVLTAALLQAQAPPVTQAPAKISFEEWKLVAASSETKEYSVSFPTPLPSTHPENNVVPLRIFVPANAKRPVPTVVVLHYWGATDLKFERALCLDLARNGIGSAIMTLPYHLSRTPPGFRSGALAIQADPELLIATMTQSSMDVRRTVDFLESRPEFSKGELGIAGTSLGALVASLVYGVEPRFHFAALMLGGIDLAHIIWKSSRVVTQREILRANGYTEALLREQLTSIEPGSYLPSRTGGSAFVIGARYDTVIPRESTEALIGDLPGAKSLWLPTGHYGGVFVQHRLLNEVSRFFAAGFSGQTYTPPAKVLAPTVRLGGEMNSSTGFNIEIGLDLLRPSGTKSPFASFLVSPRGAKLFFGQGIDRGVAIGVTVSGQRPGIGMLWSTVL